MRQAHSPRVDVWACNLLNCGGMGCLTGVTGLNRSKQVLTGRVREGVEILQVLTGSYRFSQVGGEGVRGYATRSENGFKGVRTI